MAWIAPATHAAAVLTAAQMNAVRDNFLELETAKVTRAGDRPYATGANALSRVPLGSVAGTVDNPKTVYKLHDTPLALDVSAQDDDELLFPIGANETWVLDAVIYVSSPTPADFKGGWHGPVGVTGMMIAFFDAPGFLAMQATALTNARNPQAGFATHGAAATTMDVQTWNIYAVNGAEPGVLAFCWAQFVSDSGITTVHKGSFISGYQV